MKLTLALLQERDELIAANREAKSVIDTNDRRIKAIEACAAESLGRKKSMKKSRYRISWQTVLQNVSWKSEFIRVAGVDEATKLTNNRKSKKRLNIKKE